MHDLAASILVLAIARKSDRQHLAARMLAHQPDGGILHGQLRAEIAVHPFHRRALIGHGALGDEVIDVLRPVLNGGVAYPRILVDDDLHDGAVQAI